MVLEIYAIKLFLNFFTKINKVGDVESAKLLKDFLLYFFTPDDMIFKQFRSILAGSQFEQWNQFTLWLDECEKDEYPSPSKLPPELETWFSNMGVLNEIQTFEGYEQYN